MYYIYAFGYYNRYVGEAKDLDTAIEYIHNMVQVYQGGQWHVEAVDSEEPLYELKAYNGFHEYEWHHEVGRIV